jgi:zinc protease
MWKMILRSACLIVVGQVCAAAEYAIVVSEATRNEPPWAEVFAALSAKHAEAEVVPYRHHVAEAQPTLAKLHPRSTCFVATLDESGRDFVAAVHRLTRSYDEDPWTDTLWGILTSVDAANALAIAKHDAPLTVRKVASGTDVKLLTGGELNPLIADDFVLVPNPREGDPDKKYVVSFRGQPLPE